MFEDTKIRKLLRKDLNEIKKLKKKKLKEYRNDKEILKTEKQNFNFLIWDKNEQILDTYNNKFLKYILRNKPLIILYILLFILMFLFGYYLNIIHQPNIQTEYYEFRMDKEILYVDNYLKDANTLIISTGGGAYSPTCIMISHSLNCEDLKVEDVLENFAYSFTIEPEKMEKTIKKDFAEYKYVLNINEYPYKIMSKSIKYEDKIVCIFYINSGTENKENQQSLYEVYDTFDIIK